MQCSELYYAFLSNLKSDFTDFSKWNKWEILLNILFIIIVCIFSLIIYWDSINRKVASTSRCKRQMDIYNKKKGTSIVKATDTSKKPLYTVSYDMNQKNVNVECSCQKGDFVNYFNDIRVKNMKTNKDELVNKVCSCDQYYNLDNVLLDGDQGVTRYMLGKDSGFFDDLLMMDH